MGGFTLRKATVLAVILLALGAGTALAADSSSSSTSAGSEATTRKAELVRTWRHRVVKARKIAVRRAHLVGIHPRIRKYERNTTSPAYLLWLRNSWRSRGRGWFAYYLQVRPGLMCIHSYEGAWNAYNPAGYYGGLQMDWSFMRTYGYDKLVKYGGRDARYWSINDQLAVAIRAIRTRGYTPWSTTASMCGLL